MKRKTIGALAFGAALVAGAALAQDGDHMSQMSTRPAPDARRELDFPPPMRAHFRANMLGHFDALSDIVAALAAGDGARAASIARGKLGMESPGAAACKPEAAQGGNPMAAMMAQHMPQEMRDMGLVMHAAASAFAGEAEKLKKGGDPQPALAKLSEVTQACSSCHAAFRLP